MPRRRGDGLVVERPTAVEIEYDDPMWQNFGWVAMLDPVELSHGVEVSEVESWVRLGRLTWTASCRALPGEEAGYEPRCSCCALLFGEVSVAIDGGDASAVRADGAAFEYPSSYRVSLDAQTGIVVAVEARDGDGSASAFSNEIHAVDAGAAHR